MDDKRFGRWGLLHSQSLRLCKEFKLIPKSSTYVHKLIDKIKAEE